MRQKLSGDAGRYARSNHPLDSIVSEENIKEILGALTRNQLIAIMLRLEGLTNVQIATLLGVSKMAITLRFRLAKGRVMRFVPEIADSVAGRSFPSGPPSDEKQETTTPLEHGYVCQEARGNRGEAKSGRPGETELAFD